MSTPRKKQIKTDPAQLILQFGAEMRAAIDAFTLTAFQSVAAPPRGPDSGHPPITPPPKPRRAKSTKGSPQRAKARDQVNILARQSGMEVHDVWCHAYKELLHRTGFNATALSYGPHNHLDMVDLGGRLPELLQVLSDMQASPYYAPSALV